MCVKGLNTHPCVILQDKRRDVDLLRQDAGEELLQVLYVMDFLFKAWYTKSCEEPCRDLMGITNKSLRWAKMELSMKRVQNRTWNTFSLFFCNKWAIKGIIKRLIVSLRWSNLYVYMVCNFVLLTKAVFFCLFCFK